MLLALRHFEEEWIYVNVDFERVCVCVVMTSSAVIGHYKE